MFRSVAMLVTVNTQTTHTVKRAGMLRTSGPSGSLAVVTESKADVNVLGRQSATETTAAFLRMHCHTQSKETQLRVASVYQFRRPLT
jgi:hypothetical protein